MKVSRTWLQTFFSSPLPAADILVETANLKMVEVEGVEEFDGDTVIDLKILADRAAYMLSHQGVARDYAATLGLELKDRQIPRVTVADGVAKPSIKLESSICRRYTARRVEVVTVAQSPEWLVQSLTKLGQRSINNIVDMANFVMFDIGQPLHAFDVDKIVGNIIVRLAIAGEKITTLDGKEVILNDTDLVIADDNGPIGIAGVKGGKRAEVTSATKNLILESANFNPSSVRKTSTRLNLRTDASKRFENNLTPDLTLEALGNFSALIAEAMPGAKFGEIVDEYPNKEKETSLVIDPSWVSARLGMEVPAQEQVKILERMGLRPTLDGTKIVVTVPTYRRDLTIPEDFVEEIGRIWGYDKLPQTLPPFLTPAVNKEYYYTEKLRNILRDAGFSEVYLYSLVPSGELEVQLPLADDKKCYRTNLRDGLEECLVQNKRRAPLLETESVDIFEIGHVYKGGVEQLVLAVASTVPARMTEIVGLLESEFANLKSHSSIGNTSSEFVLEEILKDLSLPSSYESLNIEFTQGPVQFGVYSQYPFVLRDIALWTPAGTKGEDIEKIIKSEGGEWLVRVTQFDTFTKPASPNGGGEQTSFAFHLVFQSMERTLTDSDVNAVHARITKALNATLGFAVR